MTIANKDCICSSCGDSIKTGAKITLISFKKQPTQILCFRCHPESETSKVKMEISGKTVVNHSKKKPFFETRK